MKQFITGLKKGMKLFGESLSTVVNTILLLIVYVIGVGLSAVIAKLFKKHFLDFTHDKKSYWSDLNLKKKTMKDYYRQF